MTTITFDSNNATIEVESAHLNDEGDTILTEKDAYDLFSIKSIIPPKEGAPTKLQNQFIKVLQSIGYKWDKPHSAGVVLRRADGEFLFRDFWFFGLEGEIMHNPEALLSIKL
jgi:hypothetical protein